MKASSHPSSDSARTGERRTSAGFTLVEVALALLVASIGLLSVFSLFPAGLDMNRRAIADAQTALFAQDVFSGLRAQVVRTNNYDWTEIDQIRIPMTGKDRWTNPGDTVEFTGASTWETMQYVSTLNGVEYAFRYQLVLNELGGNPLRKAVLLRVIAGQFNNNPTNAVEFYTELFNPAML